MVRLHFKEREVLTAAYTSHCCRFDHHKFSSSEMARNRVDNGVIGGELGLSYFLNVLNI